MRLDKFLCDCELGSRSEVKKYIKQGRVSVAGETITAPNTNIETTDEVLLDGNIVEYQQYIYYLFHKPAGCVCANKDDLHDTVFSYVPINKKADLFTVGRLDLDTEGLLLITNDGDFAHQLLSPKKHVDKLYFAKLNKESTNEDVIKFQQGIDIGEEKILKPAKLEISSDDPTEVFITISEGKFHQVKRMVKACGKEVMYLKRLSMGKFTLDETLKKGEYRTFTKEELEYVREYKSGIV